MAAEETFKRTEKKFIMTIEQYEKLMSMIGGSIVPGEYPETAITSIYYDTENYDMIIESIEHPLYKEKFRVRIYDNKNGERNAFGEIKKKYDHVVYKRRIPLVTEDLMKSIEQGESISNYLYGCKAADPQKTEEIRYMIERRKLKPKILIRCDRSSYAAAYDNDVRITFDRNLFGKHEGDLTDDKNGLHPIIGQDLMIMEIKAPLAMPLWLSRSINDAGIRRSRFSKVGTYFSKYIGKELGERLNAQQYI